MCPENKIDYCPCEYGRDRTHLCRLSRFLLAGELSALDENDRRWLRHCMSGVEDDAALDAALPRLATTMRGGNPPLASISRNFRRHPAMFGMRYEQGRWLPTSEASFNETLRRTPLLSLGELLQLVCLASRGDDYFGLWLQDAAIAYDITPLALGGSFDPRNLGLWYEQGCRVAV